MTDKPLSITPTLQNTSDSISTDNFLQNESENTWVSELIHMHDRLHDCVFIFRADNFHFIYVNKGAQLQVGYTDVELLKMTPLDIKPEFTLESFQQMVQPLIDDDKQSLHIFHTILRHKNGQDIPVEATLQLIHHNSHGRCFLNIVRNNALFENTNNSLKQRIKDGMDASLPTGEPG